MNQIEKIEHEIMLPLIEALEKATEDFRKLAQANQAPADEPKPSKKLVDWSCLLLKGCNTNKGELLIQGCRHWFADNQLDFVGNNSLRLSPPTTPTINWQVYHQGETNLQTLHDAGFVVQIKHFLDSELLTEKWNPRVFYGIKVHYRVIGIQEGFTDVPESAT